jgi:hypothetical protein
MPRVSVPKIAVPRGSGKTCIPGLFCIENVTMFLMFIVLVVLAYLYYVNVVAISNSKKVEQLSVLGTQGSPVQPAIIVVSPPIDVAPPALATIGSRQDPLNDPYVPPMNTSGMGMYFPEDSGNVHPVVGLPVNMTTRGPVESYSPVGILTRQGNRHGGDMVLPLMGRRSMTGRTQYQYYTMMPSGNLNTKLPVSVNGKSCTTEYGCNEISNGDLVYVDGLNDTFRATIYETGVFSYIPYL